MPAPTRGPVWQRRRWLAAAAGLATPLGSWANVLPPELREELPAARLAGQGRLRFFGLSVYDARLWRTAAPGPEPWQQPLALELAYTRDLVGDQIAERSLVEMRRVGEVSPSQAERWLAQMRQLFPDVRAGDRITGVHRPGEGARFFLNGRRLGEVADANFARLFFAIWLSPRTSEPALRAQLLGEAAR